MVSSLAVALSCLAIPAAASADPGEPACSFTLSPPHVVQLSGTNVVAVTLSPAGCNDATPYQSVACVQLQGSPGPGRCKQNNGLLTAQVYLSPHQPGATYVATGRGCATKGNPPQPVCEPTGPLAATL